MVIETVSRDAAKPRKPSPHGSRGSSSSDDTSLSESARAAGSPASPSASKHGLTSPAPLSEKPSNTQFQVDPGFAALVMRQYLLPMFEGGQSVVTDRSGIEELIDKVPVGGAPNEGILGELKLSDQLLDELRQTKQDARAVKLKWLGGEQEEKRLKKRVESLQKGIERAVHELFAAKGKEQNLRQESFQIESEYNLLTLQSEELSREILKLQAGNSRMAARLLEEEGKVEVLSQVVAQNENTSSLAQLESDVLQGQVQSLHAKVAGLFGQTKNALDERAFDLALHEICYAKVDAYCGKIEGELHRVRDERQTLSNEKAELETSNAQLEVLRTRLLQELNDQKNKNQNDVIKLYDEKEQVRKEKEKMSKKLKELTEDRDKLKQRMKKYRMRRLFDQDTSTCRNCGKDFVKTENFNWSCRTHTSEFGGEMWWCCGKLGLDGLGCKFSKHESKDDDDELDEKEKKEKDENEQRIRNLNVRCYGCKDVGHKASNCLRDPNIRTSYNPQKELVRLTQAYDADASKKQLRQTNSQAIAELVNEKIGFTCMNLEDPDEPRQPFTDLIELARSNVKVRREQKSQEQQVASEAAETVWGAGYESNDSETTSNTEGSDDGDSFSSSSASASSSSRGQREGFKSSDLNLETLCGVGIGQPRRFFNFSAD